MFCSKCGKQAKDDDKFCAGCGAALANVATPAVEAQKTYRLSSSPSAKQTETSHDKKKSLSGGEKAIQAVFYGGIAFGLYFLLIPRGYLDSLYSNSYVFKVIIDAAAYSLVVSLIGFIVVSAFMRKPKIPGLKRLYIFMATWATSTMIYALFGYEINSIVVLVISSIICFVAILVVRSSLTSN